MHFGDLFYKNTENGINRPYSALLAITMGFGKNGLVIPLFGIFVKTNPQNALNNI